MNNIEFDKEYNKINEFIETISEYISNNEEEIAKMKELLKNRQASLITIYLTKYLSEKKNILPPNPDLFLNEQSLTKILNIVNKDLSEIEIIYLTKKANSDLINETILSLEKSLPNKDFTEFKSILVQQGLLLS